MDGKTTDELFESFSESKEEYAKEIKRLEERKSTLETENFMLEQKISALNIGIGLLCEKIKKLEDEKDRY